MSLRVERSKTSATEEFPSVNDWGSPSSVRFTYTRRVKESNAKNRILSFFMLTYLACNF